MPGPQPIPTAEKIRMGNPGKQRLNRNEPQPDGTPSIPDYLINDRYAIQIWDRVVRSMPAGVFTALDGETLAAYCYECSIYRRAALTLEMMGTERWVNALGHLSPWHRIRREAAVNIAKLGTRLGLSPSARAAISVPTRKPGGKFAGLTRLPKGAAKQSEGQEGERCQKQLGLS